MGKEPKVRSEWGQGEGVGGGRGCLVVSHGGSGLCIGGGGGLHRVVGGGGGCSAEVGGWGDKGGCRLHELLLWRCWWALHGRVRTKLVHGERSGWRLQSKQSKLASSCGAQVWLGRKSEPCMVGSTFPCRVWERVPIAFQQ